MPQSFGTLHLHRHRPFLTRPPWDVATSARFRGGGSPPSFLGCQGSSCSRARPGHPPPGTERGACLRRAPPFLSPHPHPLHLFLLLLLLFFFLSEATRQRRAQRPGRPAKPRSVCVFWGRPGSRAAHPAPHLGRTRPTGPGPRAGPPPPSPSRRPGRALRPCVCLRLGNALGKWLGGGDPQSHAPRLFIFTCTQLLSPSASPPKSGLQAASSLGERVTAAPRDPLQPQATGLGSPIHY